MKKEPQRRKSKNGPYDNAHHTFGSHTSSGTYLHRPCSCITGALQVIAFQRPVQPIFTFPMQVFRSTIQGLLHASLLLQQCKPTYPKEYFLSFLSSFVEAQSLLPSYHISCFLVNTIFPLLSFISAGGSNTSCRFSGIKHITFLFDGPGVGVSTSRPLQLSARCYRSIAAKSFAHIDHPTLAFSVSLL